MNEKLHTHTHIHTYPHRQVYVHIRYTYLSSLVNKLQIFQLNCVLKKRGELHKARVPSKQRLDPHLD